MAKLLSLNGEECVGAPRPYAEVCWRMAFYSDTASIWVSTGVNTLFSSALTTLRRDVAMVNEKNYLTLRADRYAYEC